MNLEEPGMINLENVQKAVNNSDLQTLRQIDSFINYFGDIYVTGNYEKMSLCTLSELLENLNSGGYLIYDGSGGSVMDDANTLYFSLIKIMRSAV